MVLEKIAPTLDIDMVGLHPDGRRRWALHFSKAYVAVEGAVAHNELLGTS